MILSLLRRCGSVYFSSPFSKYFTVGKPEILKRSPTALCTVASTAASTPGLCEVIKADQPQHYNWWLVSILWLVQHVKWGWKVCDHNPNRKLLPHTHTFIYCIYATFKDVTGIKVVADQCKPCGNYKEICPIRLIKALRLTLNMTLINTTHYKNNPSSTFANEHTEPFVYLKMLHKKNSREVRRREINDILSPQVFGWKRLQSIHIR